MRRIAGTMILLAVSLAFVANVYAGDEKPTKYTVGSGAPKKAAAKKAPKKKAGGDTLVIAARLIEIPGTFPPNDLYNYVYVMKYRVLKVEKGSYSGKEILVGVYNPLIPRTKIKDKMAKYVDGTVTKFEEGGKHKLVLITPIDKVWSEAMEDEYFDSEMTKYYALKTDILK
jgi:hypothetical protein